MDVLKEIAKLDFGEKVQMIFFIILFLFMIFSMVGWVIELFFRRFVSQKKWVNPGFLKGPYLPIYGIGVVLLTFYIFAMFPLKDKFPSSFLFDILIIVGIGVLMTLIELIGGIIFIKGMKIRLWDYSNRPLNYKGIICLEFSLIWTILGAFFYYLLFSPIVVLIAKFISLDWFVLAVFLIGLFYGIFIIDLVQSLELGNKIKQYALENEITLKWDSFKIHIKEKIGVNNSKFFSPFKSSIPLKEHFKTFIKEQSEKIENIIKRK